MAAVGLMMFEVEAGSWHPDAQASKIRDPTMLNLLASFPTNPETKSLVQTLSCFQFLVS